MYAHDYLHMYIPYMPVLDVCCSFFLYIRTYVQVYAYLWMCIFLELSAEFGYNLEKLCANEILAVIYNCRHLILDFIR